jgi:hypothetical protein
MFMGPMISDSHHGTRRACPEDAYVQKKKARGCRARVNSQPQIRTRLKGGGVAPDRPVVLGIWREGCDSRMKFSLFSCRIWREFVVLLCLVYPCVADSSGIVVSFLLL